MGKEKKAGRDGVCLLTWYMSVGVMTNYSDCINNIDRDKVIKPSNDGSETRN